MNITELIQKLEKARSEYGDIEVITFDYAGGDYEEREPLCNVKAHWDYGSSPVVVLNA